MRSKRALMTAGAALIAALALQAEAASAATYDVQGSYQLVAPICTSDGCTPGGYEYDGTATCRSSCKNASSGGSLKLSLLGSDRSWPQSLCISHKVTGDLVFSPTDPYLPVLTQVSGNSVDGKGFNIRSAPTDPYKGTVSGFLGFPPNPCLPGPFTGRVELPPNPI